MAAQGHRGSVRSAIRRYVRAGFRTGFSLNPLVMERLVASQLSDVGRVPALYAYLVNDMLRVEVSVNWDARAYADEPGALDEPGGLLGHAWRRAKREGSLPLHGRAVRWDDVERAAHEAARQAGGARRAGLKPVKGDTVFVCRIGEEEDPADALRLAAEFAERGTPVILALSSGSTDQWVSASQLALRFPGAQLTGDRADLLDEVRRTTPRAVLLVRGPAADISVNDLAALAHASSEGGIVAPVWLSSIDGTVVSAGVGYRDGVGFDILSGHPSEDLRPLGPEIDVPSVRGGTRAIAPDLTRAPRVLTSVVVRAPEDDAPGDDASAADVDLNALLAPTSFEVESWRGARPVLRRRRSTVTLDDGKTVPSLRWAITIAAPPGSRGEWWGDTHFARGIADALRRRGQEVVIDAYAARDRPTAHLDDVMLALRGPEPIHARPGTTSLLWIISHPDEIGTQDLEGYDAVFAASGSWAAEASRRFDSPITPLLQCTDATRFRPHGVPRSDDLLFVGTARGIPRPSIIEPLRAGIAVSVYGPDWSGWIPGAAIKASGVPNADLPVLYEGARAVLNDHWPAMKAAGFVSNRLYDVVAAGGRIVSDDVAGIDDIFGGAALTYRDIPELLEILSSDIDERFASDAEILRISERVRTADSFDARAKTLLDAALGL